MTSVALDTNVAIEVLNGKLQTVQILRTYGLIYLPVVVCGELLFGAKNSARSASNEERCRQFIEQCEIIESNSLVAEQYASIRLELKRKGKPIPENDIWIAALCIIHDIPLFSHDGHFLHIERPQRIPTSS
jgi:tRNA(fMet)-specific endonuclease VapC